MAKNLIHTPVDVLPFKKPSPGQFDGEKNSVFSDKRTKSSRTYGPEKTYDGGVPTPKKAS